MKSISAGLLAEHVKATYRPYVRINIWDTDPDASGSLLYFSPGINTLSPASAELYSYNGVDAPQLVWTGPSWVAFTHRWAITHLYPYNNKLLIFMGNLLNDYACRVYEYDPVTGNTTLRVNDYVPYAADGSTISVFGCAEFGGKLILCHAGQAYPPILMELNPATWDPPTFLQRVDDYDDGVGGILAHTDGYIYWNTGRYIYSSTTGAASSWSQIYDMVGTYGHNIISQGLYAAADGGVYTGGVYRTGLSTYKQRIYRMVDNVVSVDNDVVSTSAQSIISAIGEMPDGLIIVSWDGGTLIKSGGIYSDDGIDPNGATCPHSATYLDKLYWGKLDSSSHLIRRDSAGSTSTVASYVGYTTWGNYDDTTPMVVL